MIPLLPQNKQGFSVHENVWVEAGQVIVNSLLATCWNLSSLHTTLVSHHLFLLLPSSMALLPFMELLSSDMEKLNFSSSPPNPTLSMIYCCYSWATQSWRCLTAVHEPEKSLSKKKLPQGVNRKTQHQNTWTNNWLLVYNLGYSKNSSLHWFLRNVLLIHLEISFGFSTKKTLQCVLLICWGMKPLILCQSRLRHTQMQGLDVFCSSVYLFKLGAHPPAQTFIFQPVSILWFAN